MKTQGTSSSGSRGSKRTWRECRSWAFLTSLKTSRSPTPSQSQSQTLLTKKPTTHYPFLALQGALLGFFSPFLIFFELWISVWLVGKWGKGTESERKCLFCFVFLVGVFINLSKSSKFERNMSRKHLLYCLLLPFLCMLSSSYVWLLRKWRERKEWKFCVLLCLCYPLHSSGISVFYVLWFSLWLVDENMEENNKRRNLLVCSILFLWENRKGTGSESFCFCFKKLSKSSKLERNMIWKHLLLSIAGLLMYVDIFSCLIAQKMKGKKRMEILCEIVLSTPLFWVFHILWFSLWLVEENMEENKKRRNLFVCSILFLPLKLESLIECLKFQLQNSDIFFLVLLISNLIEDCRLFIVLVSMYDIKIWFSFQMPRSCCAPTQVLLETYIRVVFVVLDVVLIPKCVQISVFMLLILFENFGGGFYCFRLKTLTPVSYSEDHPKRKRGSSRNIEIRILEGSQPEIYTEEHDKLLGDCKSSWTLSVDGYGKDGERIYDPVNGETCHQCR